MMHQFTYITVASKLSESIWLEIGEGSMEVNETDQEQMVI